MTPARPLPPHGTYARAVGRPQKKIPGCGCEPCILARRQYRKRLRVLNGTGRTLTVDAATAADHVRRLVAQGADRQRIAAQSDCAVHTVAHLISGQLTQIWSSTEARILRVRPSDVLSPRRMVPATGTSRRIRALMAIGHDIQAIGLAIGSDPAFVQRFAAGTQTTLRAFKAEQVADAYRRLVRSAGPSVSARRRAEREMWPGPMHWDGAAIDDPAAQPDWTGTCGTPQGYTRHRKNSKVPPPCPPCTAAYKTEQAKAEQELAA
ncbi:hypothetical protein [Kitasatospora camelliae]|uniref:Helix-turn-helix protein n=1 Tax=Kitasatospora camelliae TaxID=3156397 RepID=A0AAU8K6V0_9ACTN